MTRVAVIGAGSWGTTVASMLSRKADTVVWAREPEVVVSIATRHENAVFLPGVELPVQLRSTGSLAEAVAGRELIVMAVPAQFVAGVAGDLGAVVAPEVPVLSLTKGIDAGSLRRPTEMLTETLVGHDPARVGVLSGPNLAHEVLAGHPSATVIAMPDQDAARRIQDLLTHDRFRVYTNRDVVGCEIGGAVKNVIAIAAGMVDGLGYGWNTRAALITRGLAELARLGVALGGEPLTFLGLAGNGDLIATCSSDQSRNRSVGVELGRGRQIEEITRDMQMVAEGVATAPAVLALARSVEVQMPIATEVVAALRGERSPGEAVDALMGRMPTSELHDLPGPATPAPRAAGTSRS